MKLKEANIERIQLKIKSGRSELSIRAYRHEGQIGLSITDCCGTTVPFELQNYYRNNTPKKIKERKEATAKEGSDLHSIPDKQAKGEHVEVGENHKSWVKGLEETHEKYQIESELTEFLVFSKRYCFGGQADKLGSLYVPKWKGKRRAIMDYKTGRYNVINLWKIAAYRMAYVEMTGDDEVECAVIYQPRPELAEQGVKPNIYTVDRKDTCFLNFLCAYQTVCMQYYDKLIKAGMRSEDVYSPKPFDFYEQLKADELLNGLARKEAKDA